MAAPPTQYVLAIFPGFQLLDLAGPLDILNELSESSENSQLSLTIVAETSDPVPVKPIALSSANWTFDLQAHSSQIPGRVNASFNQYLQPDTTFADYLAAAKSGKAKADVLLIPGGIGTRLNRLHPDGSKTLNVQSLYDFLPNIAPHISTAIITVCTGSDILAQSGLLKGRRATTNMQRYDFVAQRNPGVSWQYGARWIRSLPSEAVGTVPIEIWSSAGISAGMDVTLAFVAHFHGGESVATDLAKSLEYDWRQLAEGEKDPLYKRYYSI
ncbi:hypothetical protein A1O3_00089 [Capronia epimyces CBS 606.96]|uniref:Uncharacterized protein n=1 Tax=Capronia epimyces CBS 606.96 TaxID=1182542 RepID=W9YQK8_9EURO|nr:uncharacterized protein A1O3_00089 [Capronia epimyces CBS 606.96]EXJ91541.1 hypothetical protein A1O3_00089 [Capronia epimyces CBS 606.96]